MFFQKRRVYFKVLNASLSPIYPYNYTVRVHLRAIFVPTVTVDDLLLILLPLLANLCFKDLLFTLKSSISLADWTVFQVSQSVHVSLLKRDSKSCPNSNGKCPNSNGFNKAPLWLNWIQHEIKQTFSWLIFTLILKCKMFNPF